MRDDFDVLCPQCPMCGSLPAFAYPTMAQWFCTNDDCRVLVWDPWVPAAANLADSHEATETSSPLPEDEKP